MICSTCKDPVTGNQHSIWWGGFIYHLHCLPQGCLPQGQYGEERRLTELEARVSVLEKLLDSVKPLA